MGVRGELFSTKVALQNRTYFFNVKENRLGDLYLNIVESKNKDEGGFDRQSVILFADDLQEFLRGFDESLRILEKAVREKRKGPPNKGAPASRTGHSAEPEGRSANNSRFTSRPPRQTGSDSMNRSERRFPSGERRSEYPSAPRQRRRDRDDEGGKGEMPRRSKFRERQEHRDEGQGRPRDSYKNKEKSAFAPRKRVVVKKK